ncbi:MAG: KH domain-containing protein [Methanosarcinales archaeon Met12]|nr:MAG: KH domain-containing protein [Methanosarcinales archaeon Met12]
MIHIKVPAERVGVIIGNKGVTKKTIEERSGTTIRIDSESGSIEIESLDPIGEMNAGEVIKAIGRGFSEENAFRLLDDETLVSDIIDLSKIFTTQKDIMRIKGRIIGKDGRAREVIENLSDVKISVYGKTIGIIGAIERVEIARRAIGMLIDGAPHGAVYSYLEKQRRE